ncbi:hypothetical protein Pint_02621 [Pistacia integerrima]|uniref:Uncharacterized protein n=1 Tax=Pistacia integerrima TaxID=434235 RepID=A0ACC0ZJY1_9ROSI|nr:hypothetical protein Pint_02621 [Pistacia integerrima]
MYSLLYLCRDLSFNNLIGPIPKTFNQLAKVDFMYLMGNMLTGVVPKYILESNKIVRRVHPCLKHNFPCSASSDQYRYSMHINCGGKELNIGNTKYEADIEAKGASMFYTGPGQYWAFSSTGNFMDNDVVSDVYIKTNTSALSNVSADSSELYRTARVSPLSLTYYGLCLGNGNYTVKLHFAEIIFTNYSSLNSLGRRIFDVYIQGKLVLKHFSIQDEAGGTGIPIVKNFTAPVTSNTLKIQFYWAGRGTTGIPVRGFYGPIISAISVDPNKLFGWDFGFITITCPVAITYPAEERVAGRQLSLRIKAFVLQERGNLLELVDPNLGSEYSSEEAMAMLNVALLCTNASPTLRPMMSQVVSMLEGRTEVQDLLSDAGFLATTSKYKAIRNHFWQHPSQTQSLSTGGPSTDYSNIEIKMTDLPLRSSPVSV